MRNRLQHGDAVPFRGEEWIVAIEPAPKTMRRSRVLGFDGQFHMMLAHQDRHRPRTVLKRRFRQYARDFLFEELQRSAQRLSVAYTGLSIRDQRTLWGSCSSRRHLSFNWRLVMAPPAAMRYVVLHELVHLIEHNHSARFWHRLRQVCVDVDEQEQWLKRHGPVLLAF